MTHVKDRDRLGGQAAKQYRDEPRSSNLNQGKIRSYSRKITLKEEVPMGDKTIAATVSEPTAIDAAKFPFILNFRGMGSEALQLAQQQNIEALAAATKTILESTQAIIAKNAEFFEDWTQHATKDVGELAKLDRADKVLIKQAEIAQANVRALVSNTQAIAEIANQCYFEACNLLGTRLAETIAEARQDERHPRRKRSGNGQRNPKAV